MHKNKSAESASTSPPGDSANFSADRSGDSNGTSSTSSFTMLQAAPELTRERDMPELLRDPFADDVEDGEASGSGSGSGSGSDDDAAPERGSASGWHRDGWWRGVVRSARGRGGRGEARAAAAERFGDGRDDDSDSDAVAEEEEDGDDEEFGDFAMPEAVVAQTTAAGAAAAGEGGGEAKGEEGSGVDSHDRDKDIVKPMPLHPTAGKISASPFGSLWPFSSQGFGMSSSNSSSKEKEREREESAKGKEEVKGSDDPREEPLQVRPEVGEGEGMLVDEDGKKVERAVEAKRRTSIEDPDEDEREEISVGRRG